jgi:hypothetical protein
MVRVGAACSRDARIRPAPFRHSCLDLSLPGPDPAFFRHSCESRACPGLDPGNPCSSERDGGRPPGKVKMSPATSSRSTWTPDQGRHFFRHSNPCASNSRGQRPLPQRCGRWSAWERIVAAMSGFVRPHSVIPAKAGIHVLRNETAEELPERAEISPATFSRSKWTPGLWPGVTGTEGPRIKCGVTAC